MNFNSNYFITNNVQDPTPSESNPEDVVIPRAGKLFTEGSGSTLVTSEQDSAKGAGSWIDLYKESVLDEVEVREMICAVLSQDQIEKFND